MRVEVKMPQLTQTMSEATIIRWIKNEGESIDSGEPLLEIMTDKAAVEVESPTSGVLGRVLVQTGEVPVGTTIAIIVASGEAVPDQLSVTQEQKTPVAAAADAVKPQATSQGNGKPAASRKRISPLAKRLAVELGVDLDTVTATGPGGLITEADIRRAADKSPVQAPAQPTPDEQGPRVEVAHQVKGAVETRGVEYLAKEGEEVIPLQGVRKIIAERMSLSRHTAADVTTVAEVDMGEVAALREHIDLTYTAFIARAVVLALAEFPIMNSRLQQGDKIVISKKIHLGVAVAIDEGLKVPVIKDAHTKGLRQIGLELADLSKRGAEGRLTPDELTGSTFTVTNSGVFGSLLFTPIINPPEAGIIGMAKIVKTPVVRDDQIVIRPVMNLCLTYDHRIVDGAPAVKFLQRVKALLEKPVLLL